MTATKKTAPKKKAVPKKIKYYSLTNILKKKATYNIVF